MRSSDLQKCRWLLPPRISFHGMPSHWKNVINGLQGIADNVVVFTNPERLKAACCRVAPPLSLAGVCAQPVQANCRAASSTKGRQARRVNMVLYDVYAFTE
jgi:hypothetical protein